MFPDAVTSRGARHLEELVELVARGHRAMIFFCVQRRDGRYFAPADHIDRHYGDTLRRVAAQGVEVVAYTARVTPAEIVVRTPLSVTL